MTGGQAAGMPVVIHVGGLGRPPSSGSPFTGSPTVVIPPSRPSGPLAFTGTDPGVTLGSGVLLLVVGLALVRRAAGRGRHPTRRPPVPPGASPTVGSCGRWRRIS